MTKTAMKSSRTGLMCIAGVASAALVVMAAGPALASALATAHPSFNTTFASTTACAPTLAAQPNSSPACIGADLARIDAARAREGVRPMYLPANYPTLSGADQQFVVINLERVDRGLPAIVGLTTPVNVIAAGGANAGTDPGFPAAGLTWGGSIWAAGFPSTLEAEFAWMYNDGPGSNNIACTAANTAGCWGHRDIILANPAGAPLVAGAAVALHNSASQFATEVQQPTGAQPAFVYTWATAVAAGAGTAPAATPHHAPSALVTLDSR
jgi:hypothetical protein